ncbi:UNVERIFIED_CONTAM: hypothetical protein HDU68_009069, partial [Siphonaria sp. JEL0065]
VHSNYSPPPPEHLIAPLSFTTMTQCSAPSLISESIPATPIGSPIQTATTFPATSLPQPRINPILSPKKYFAGKLLEKEPGFDILQSSPPTTPSSTISSRRASITSDGIGRIARFKPTESEATLLSAIFHKNPFPSCALRQRIAERMGLEVKQVQFWFQNKRAMMKTNGIHVVKPRRSALGDHSHHRRVLDSDGFEIEVGVAKRRVSLSPLSEDNPFFFVEKER